jgi:hypothetical protein
MVSMHCQRFDLNGDDFGASLVNSYYTDATATPCISGLQHHDTPPIGPSSVASGLTSVNAVQDGPITMYVAWMLDLWRFRLC